MTSRNFLLQPPSMEELLVLKDFKLKDERNKGICNLEICF